MSGAPAPASPLPPPADNPFLANDLARYLPTRKVEEWRLSATRELREKEIAEPCHIELEEIAALLPVVQAPMIVVANGQLVEALLPEKAVLEKTGFSVCRHAAPNLRNKEVEGRFKEVERRFEEVERRFAGGEGFCDPCMPERVGVRHTLATDPAMPPADVVMPVLGQIGLVWGTEWADHLLFDVPENTAATVHVVQVAAGHGAPVSCPLSIRVAKGATLTLVEHWASTADCTAWLNAPRCVQVQEGGALDYGVVQQLAAGAMLTLSQQVDVEDGARYAMDVVQAGGRLARIETVMAAGRQADVRLQALQLTGDRQVHDVTTRMVLAGHAPTVNVLQRNVVRAGGLAVFQGKYHVRQAAQKTDAYMRCENLLLDDRAVVNQKPELEIYADDVKCSHGASTGSLDADQLFYLQARGLAPDEARRMLVAAYVEAPLESMGSHMAKHVRPLAEAWLA